ncbi:MAG: GNAT family N-acetyltransferase [Gammaproteobacteria bacterium]
MSEYRIEISQNFPSEIQHWDSATPFHTENWYEVVRGTFGIQTQHALITNNGEIVAYLPFSKSSTGPSVANYAPNLICAGSNPSQTEINQLLLPKFPATLITSDDGDNSSTSIFNLAIGVDFSDYWQNVVHQKARYDVRKGERKNVVTHFNHPDGHAIFSELYGKRMRELGSAAFGSNFFRLIKRVFGDEAFYAISFSDETPVAASLLLSHRGSWLGHPWSVSDSGYRRYSVNYTHYRDLVRFAYENNFRNFYMGPSLKQSNWARIKKRFGAREWFAVRIDGLRQRHPSESSIVSLSQAILRRTPYSLYRRVSPLLARWAIRHLR